MVVPVFKVTPAVAWLFNTTFPVIAPVLPVPPAASNASPMACAVVAFVNV